MNYPFSWLLGVGLLSILSILVFYKIDIWYKRRWGYGKSIFVGGVLFLVKPTFCGCGGLWWVVVVV